MVENSLTKTNGKNMPTITISKPALDHLNAEKKKLSSTKGRSVTHSEAIENMKLKNK
jgi:hypothetical protein